MKLNPIEKVIGDVEEMNEILIQGCEEHPTYSAVRRPIADCKRCRDIYLLVKGFKGVLKTYKELSK